MKRITILLSVMFLYLNSFSQEKMEGFGILKIGMSVSQLFELRSSNKIKEETVAVFFNKDTFNIKEFYIKKIKVSENVELKDVYLRFYKDSLRYIDCYFTKDLNKAVTLKYFDVKDKIIKTNYFCRIYRNSLDKVRIELTTDSKFIKLFRKKIEDNKKISTEKYKDF